MTFVPPLMSTLIVDPYAQVAQLWRLLSVQERQQKQMKSHTLLLQQNLDQVSLLLIPSSCLRYDVK